jgi:hypothetical protein
MVFIYDELNKNIFLFLKNDYFTLVRIIFLFISVLNVLKDIKKKEVYPVLLIVFSVILLVFNVMIKPAVFLNILAGYMIFIIIFIILYIATKGNTGLGDLLYIIFFISGFGYFLGLTAFIISYWIATLVLFIPVILKKVNLKSEIPFIPFLFAGSLFSVCYGYFIVK